MNDDHLLVQPKLLRLLMKSMKGATFGVWTAAGQCLFLEGPALPVFGYSEPFTQYTGRYYHDLVPEGRRKAFKKVIDRVVYGEHVHIEYPVGNTVMELRGTPVLEGGLVTHVLIYTNDVTVHLAREKLLLEKNATDTLTALPKRAILQVHVDGLIRLGIPFSLMFIDLDDFKKVNDTQGHATGDQLLKNVSKRIQATIRITDLAVRLGGDEFVVVVTDPANVIASAARVLANVREETETFGAGASLGVALYPQDGRTLDELLGKADAAMYRAKESGRLGPALAELRSPTELRMASRPMRRKKSR